jgi:hypothetical protein
MKTKSITLLFIATLFLLASLTSCSRKATLSDTEALRIIQQSGGLSAVPVNFPGTKADSPLGQELSRLVKEGFLTLQPSLGGYWPTPKGAGMVGHCGFNDLYGEWEVINIVGLQPKPTSITSKLIDSKSGTAVVKFEVSWTPTDYLTRLCQLDPKQFPALVSQQMSQLLTNREITLKLWDDGWHPQ